MGTKSFVEALEKAASMRPRFMNRGSVYMTLAPRSQPVYRFNEAPIHESGKYHEPLARDWIVASASMRPRFMNRGSSAIRHESTRISAGFNEAPIHESGKCERVRRRNDRRRASMRPRFMNRGSEKIITQPSKMTLASMRPRFMNRGSDAVTNAKIAAGAVLQ